MGVAELFLASLSIALIALCVGLVTYLVVWTVTGVIVGLFEE